MKKSTIISILFLRCLLFVFTFISLSLIFDKSLTQIGKWWSIVCSVMNLITLLVLFKLAKIDNMTYRQLIQYQKKESSIKLIVMGVFVVVILGISGMFLAGFITYGEFPYLAKDLVAPIPVLLAIINIGILPLSTTLAEDGLYLGFGVNKITNKWIGLLIPASIYALQHCFIPLYLDLNYMIYRFLSFLPLTILICLWYQKKHNPIPIMAGHFVINLATAIQILVMSSSPDIYNLLQ